MIHLGDITALSGYDVTPVDVVTGGSPCQDLSVAGNGDGLDGKRSGLFLEQIRLIKEMRDADIQRGRSGLFVRPRYMVWENVPGAFSSHKGQDFKRVLEETIRIIEPDAPPFHYLNAEDGRWRTPTSETDGLSPTEFLTLSFGECPSAAVESRLSQILEADPPPKYSLSAAACKGILNRARKRGREMPPELEAALIWQAEESSAYKETP